MAIREFLLPDMGSGSKEATVANWLVAVGDSISADELLCEIETEKSAIEVPAPYNGVIVSLACNAGETVMVGDILATIDDNKEDTASAPTKSQTPSETNGNANGNPETAHNPTTVSGLAPKQNHADSDRVRAMPSARRLAEENNIDIHTVSGSGKHGRVTKGDILAALKSTAPTSVEPLNNTHSPQVEPEVIRFNAMRKAISDHMSKSWREIPHVFTELEVHGAALLELKATLSESFDMKIPLEMFLIRAAIDALHAFPNFNATLEGDTLTRHRHYNIGAATATPDGLIVPVIQNADKLTPRNLASAIRTLADKSMKRKITPGEQSGLTFTVNNIGALGHAKGTSIIPYGTVGILSACRMTKRPASIDGELMLAPMMTLTLSFDHRVIDGAEASAFIQHIGDKLTSPLGLIVD